MTQDTITPRTTLSRMQAAYAHGYWEGEQTPEDLVCERFNCGYAAIDADGDVYIADPQSGHWLSDSKLDNLVAWFAERGVTID